MPRSMIKTSDITKFWTAVLNLGMVLVALYATSFYSYVLFHTLAETVSVILAVSIFLVAWNTRRYWNNSYYVLIGFSFLFVGVIDLFHAFEYKGVGIIQSGGSSNIATQLWLAGRYLIAVSFLAAPFLSHRRLKARVIFAVLASITVFLFLSIFFWKIFPVAYVDGEGITPFKKVSEYVLIAVFMAGFAYFYRMRREFNSHVFRLLSLVMLTMALTEVCFTLYVGVYDFFNLLGHLLKIVAYYLAYLGIVEFGLMRPYQTLFKDLNDKSASLRRATEEWSLMFNSITDPAFILNTDHTVTKVNKAMCDFAGVSKEELVGKKCFEFMHKSHQPWVTCPMKTTCHSKRPHTEEIDDPAMGKTLLITTSPIMDDKGDIIGILHIAKDITEQKEIERAKDEFISLASHQLRTPLSSISLASELLLKGAEGDVDPQQKVLLDEIYQSTRRMSQLISRMLNVSRIEMNTLSVSKHILDISAVVDKILVELESQIKEKNMVLQKEFERDLPRIKSDENILRMITENLVANAIRYTPAGGKIAVSLRREKGEVVLSVCDTGCGIPEKEKKDIFKKSFRAENAKKICADGNGLGLYMVKSVADKIGSKVGFESQEGEGSTFFVSFPVGEAISG